MGNVTDNLRICNLAQIGGIICACFAVSCGSVVSSNEKDGAVDAPVDGAFDARLPSGCKISEIPGAFSFDFNTGPFPDLVTDATAPARVELADGVAKIIPGMTSAPAYASVVVKAPVDLRGHRTRVQLVQMVATDKPVIALMAIISTANSSIYAEIIERAGNIEVRSWNNGTMTLLLRTQYIVAKNQYWQFRESQQRLYIENSADGNVYDSLVTVNTPSWYASAKVALAAGTSENISGSLGAVHFDNLIDCE
jgi:hypothetical protein